MRCEPDSRKRSLCPRMPELLQKLSFLRVPLFISHFRVFYCLKKIGFFLNKQIYVYLHNFRTIPLQTPVVGLSIRYREESVLHLPYHKEAVKIFIRTPSPKYI